MTHVTYYSNVRLRTFLVDPNAVGSAIKSMVPLGVDDGVVNM